MSWLAGMIWAGLAKVIGLILYIHEFIALNLPNITIQIEICFSRLTCNFSAFFVIIIYLILSEFLQNLYRMN